MTPQHTPMTAGERRGLIALAMLALLVVAATLTVKMINGSTREAEPAVTSVETVSALPDSVANPQKIVRKKKTAKKKSAARKSVPQQPDERDFLNERNDRNE